MPPDTLPAPLTQTLSTTSADFADYLQSWQNGQKLYYEGRTDQALVALTRASTLNATLLNNVEADRAYVAFEQARICWELRLPGCAVSNIKAAATSKQLTADLLSKGINIAAYSSELAAVSNVGINGPKIQHFAIAELRIVDLDLYTRALQLEARRKWKNAWDLLSKLDEQLKAGNASLRADSANIELARANAATIAGKLEDAVTLYEDWLYRERVNGTPPADIPLINAVQITLVPLNSALWPKHYDTAVNYLRANNWQGALEEFDRADGYVPMPMDEIGIAESNLHLYTGCGTPAEELAAGLSNRKSNLDLAYAAYQEYLNRLPTAPDRTQVQAAMQALHTFISNCHNQPLLDLSAIPQMAAALFLHAVQHDMAQVEQQIAAQMREQLYQEVTLEFAPTGGAGIGIGDTVPEAASPGSTAAPSGSGNVFVMPGSAGHYTIIATANFVPPVNLMPLVSPSIGTVSVATSATSKTVVADRRPADDPNVPLNTLPPHAPFTAQEVGRSIDASVILPGDLIVTRDDGLKSQIIRNFEGYSKNDPEGVSHVMLAVGNGLVVEAVGPGVRIVTLEQALQGDTYAMVMRDSKLTDPSKAVSFAMSKVGAKYDFQGIVTHPRFGIFSNSGIQMTDHYFCSELIDAAYKAADAPLFLPPAASAPSDYPALGFLDGVIYIGTLLMPAAGQAPGEPTVKPIPILMK
jgi:hypothetical protein